MPFVLRKSGQEDNPILAVPYGRQITQGLTAYYSKVGSQTVFISILGQGELDGIDRVYYAGDLIPEFNADGSRNWRFHPGTFSTGFDDPVQGRPEFFPDLDFTFSGIAYIEVKLPVERSTDDEPDKMKFFVCGRKVQDYTLSGSNLVPSGARKFSANNALVVADIMTSFMQLPLSRIDGPSLLAFRDRCNELISWAGGNQTLVTGQFINLTGVSQNIDLGSIHRTATGSTWGVAGAVTRSSVDATVDSYFEFVAGEGTFTCGYTSNSTASSDSDIVFGVQCNLANVFSVVINGVTTANTIWSPGNVFRVSIESGIFHLYHNGVEVITSVPAVPVGSLKGAIAIFSEGAGIDSSKFYPASTIESGGLENKVPRYEAHVVFAQGTDAATALETAMFRAPGCHWQDVDGKIKFMTVPSYTDITGGASLPTGGRALSFELVYDPTQTVKKTNIGDSSFNANRKALLDKPNFLRSSFRDLGQQYYDIAYSMVDRREVRAQAKALVDPGITAFGVMTQSLSDRILETQMSLLTDLDLFVNIKGMAGSEIIAKGDIVRLSHDVPGWRSSSPPLFMVVEETFEPTVGSGSTADERTFKLQLYNPGFYSDTSHKAVAGINITPTVSPWSAPPVVTNVELSQRATLQPDDSIALSVDGLVTFASWDFDQYGRIWIRRTEEERTFTVNGTTDVFSLAGHNFVEGTPVMLSGTLPPELDSSTVYFVTDITIDTFKLTKSIGGLTVDVSTGGGNIAPFTRTQDLIHPASGTGTFTIPNVQIGLLKVIVVSENFFQTKLPFQVHPVWSIDVEAPTIPVPTPFDGFFDDATGDLLLEWSGVSLQNELYELEIRNSGNTANLRPAILIDPAKNRHLEEYVIWDSSSSSNPSTTYLFEGGGVILGGFSDSVISKASAEIVGGFLAQFQTQRTDWNPSPPNIGWLPMQFVGIMPEGTTPAYPYVPLYWQMDTIGSDYYVFPEGIALEGFNPYRRKVIPGDILGIYIRPDGVAEYHVNYSPSSKPVYISGKPVDTSVLWKTVAFGLGAIQRTTWLRQGSEWKYLQQAQRVDNSLGSSDPLPTTVTARVRQLAYSGASDWNVQTFTR